MKPVSLIRFRLYVAGNAPPSTRALENLRALGERYLSGAYELELVDVLQQPARAFKEGILVTPTLIKVAPEPAQVLVGDLSDLATVVTTLGLSHQRAGE